LIKINAYRDKGLPSFANFTVQFFYLLFVQEQFAFAQRIMIKPVCIGVRADMCVNKVKLSMLNNGMAVL